MTTATRITPERWERIVSFSEVFTCYSAAMASWRAAEDDTWPATVNPGLSLTITDAGEGIFGFAYFPSSLRAELGLVRLGADDPRDAAEGVLAEIAANGRVIVAGDGFHLPWHVAYGRRHTPHWYVLEQTAKALVVFDAFAARNDLGLQAATSRPVARDSLPGILRALPEEDPVLRLREELAFGDDTAPLAWHAHQWFVEREVGATRAPPGAEGPAGLLRLAAHFRERGQDPAAYAQADDIWSIGRHRAFLCRHADEVAAADGDETLRRWLDDHGLPLARRWGHVAPLLMQATLALGSGRPASSSVAEVLAELAEREASAAEAYGGDLALLGDRGQEP